MSEIQQSPPLDPPPPEPQVEIDLNDMGDRFKVAEYLLKLRDNPLFADDPHPAARFVAEAVSAFADERMRALMGADQNEQEVKLPFDDAEIQALKALVRVTPILLELVAELQRPQQPQQVPPPQQRPTPQQRPVPAQTPHIPGRRGPQAPLPQVGTVGRGPLSRPILSKEEMEATTHAQAQVAARRARNAFLSFRTGANPGRDHAGPDEG